MQVQTSTSETRPRAARNTASPRLKTVRKRAKALRPKKSSFHRRAHTLQFLFRPISRDDVLRSRVLRERRPRARRNVKGRKDARASERASGGRYVGNTKATKEKEEKEKEAQIKNKH